MRFARLAALIVAMAIAGTACAGPLRTVDPDAVATDPAGAVAETTPPSSPGGPPPERDSVTVQFGPFFGAQQAGFYAADVQEYLSGENIDVAFQPGTPDIDPTAGIGTPDGATFFVGDAAQALRARETGLDLVNIAQLLQRSGTRIVSLKGGPTSVAGLQGKTLGLLDDGRQWDALAAVAAEGLNPAKDVKTTGGYAFVEDPAAPPVVDVLTTHAADAVQANTYDELAQLLEFPDPATGKQLTADDLNVIDVGSAPDALLQDGIWASASWLADPANQAIAVRFLSAVLRGYVYCRDAVDDCAQLVVDQSAPLPIGHQQWGVNEVNALVWPAPGGIGSVTDATWAATVQGAIAAGAIKKDPGPDARRTDLLEKARATLTNLDLIGSGYTKADIPITPGGVGTEPEATPPPVETPEP